MVELSKYITIKETCRQVGVTRPIILKYIQQGKLSAIKKGFFTYVVKESVESLLKQRGKKSTISNQYPEGEYYPLQEAAKKLGISMTTMNKYVAKGLLTKYKVGYYAYVSKNDLETMLLHKKEKFDERIETSLQNL